MNKVLVTTVKNKPYLQEQAERLAAQLACPYWQRREQSLPQITQLSGCDVLVVLGDKRLMAKIGEAEFFFHPSMALLRLMNYLKGEPDRFAEALQITPGMQLLDCTLGFASDAVVAGFLCGAGGSVTGLEASPVVALLVRYGLCHFKPKVHQGLDVEKAQVLKELPQAMQRIKVVNLNHLDFLRQAADKSYDVVYFDPMFRHPGLDSAAMNPLRRLAVPDALHADAIKEACRVARQRVVLKESRYSSEFKRLGFTVLPGGKYSEVGYGVIEL